MSFIFYGWWDWRFIFLLIASGLLDFFSALAMLRWKKRKKFFLILSLIGNIGALAAFKYLDFFTSNINNIVQYFGINYQIPAANLILPVGISFYTFQSMSYTIDVYRDQLKPTKNILHFFSYLSLFPQLVAGPIVRAKSLLPQLTECKNISEKTRWEGTRLIALGYFKKVVIADNLAPAINEAFNISVPPNSAAYWWVVTIMFAFQIYCDFSGYSSIARGLGKWMGFEFPVNFDSPYLATSFKEFWQRWHISLSTWFRDYVYIPLGGSRTSPLKTYRNLWITMVLCGLWHGAKWNFIAWGALHAFYLSLEKMTDWPNKLKKLYLGRLLTTTFILIQVLVAWVFFRANDLPQALEIIKTMFNLASINYNMLKVTVPHLFLVIIVLRQVYKYLNIDTRINKLTFYKTMQPILIALVLLCCIYLRGPGSKFIYFQF